MEQLHLKIKGKVQGVFFRASAKQEADKLGVTGWVKNVGEDGVEVIAQGEKEKLEQLFDWCQSGPSRAAVRNISAMWEDVSEVYKSFEII